MKQYQYPVFLVRLFRCPYFHLHIRQCNVITPCREGPRADVASMPNCVHAGRSLGFRHYSSGLLDVNRIPESFNDIRSNGGVEVSETVEDFHLQSNSNESGGANRTQNVEFFQQWSSPGSHNPVKGGTYTQDLGHEYLEKSVQQKPSYFGERNVTASQQANGHWNTNSGTCQQYLSNLSTVNAVPHHPGVYQPENMGAQPSLNVCHLTDKVEASKGYHKTPLRPHQQDFNGSYNPQMLPQRQMNAAVDENLGQNNENVDDEDVDGTLEELDALCKKWDLESAVNCMKKLSWRGVGIDLPRYMSLIEACGEGNALVEARAVHEHLLNFFSPLDTSIFNRIIEMYGKCGSMNDVYDTFNKMPERNLISWDNMIGWFAKNGLGEDAIDMFTKFKEAGLKPDGQMLFGVFDACGVVGDVTEGMLYFYSMSKLYGIAPSMDHYASIVHMFGSAGDLDGALEFIEKMPVEPSIDVWESLMNISRIQGNVELGDRCAQIIEQLDPSRLTKESKTGLLAVKESDTLKEKVRKASLLDHSQHDYKAGDRSHPESVKIYALLRGFKESMKESGYVPETRFVLHDINQEEKEEAIMAHSERLACAYSLMTSNPRALVHIMKNLRMCGDCHSVFKMISELVGRVIVMKDQKSFHHFRDGKCSCKCNDYW